LFTNKFGQGVVKSAKVSINPNYSSRGYGFVHFQTVELAQEAVKASKELGIDVFPYAPKDRRDIRKTYNNIYVKNFPEEWNEQKLREIFSEYGNIISLVVMKKKREGAEAESSFAFICFNDPTDREHGPKAAFNAVQ
jgi:polyadenylate-binding protein